MFIFQVGCKRKLETQIKLEQRVFVPGNYYTHSQLRQRKLSACGLFDYKPPWLSLSHNLISSTPSRSQSH